MKRNVVNKNNALLDFKKAKVKFYKFMNDPPILLFE